MKSCKKNAVILLKLCKYVLCRLCVNQYNKYYVKNILLNLKQKKFNLKFRVTLAHIISIVSQTGVIEVTFYIGLDYNRYKMWSV